MTAILSTFQPSFPISVRTIRSPLRYGGVRGAMSGEYTGVEFDIVARVRAKRGLRRPWLCGKGSIEAYPSVQSYKYLESKPASTQHPHDCSEVCRRKSTSL